VGVEIINWLTAQNGDNKGFTIRGIYKGLLACNLKVSQDSVWSNVALLKKKNLIVPVDSIPLRWKLNRNKFKEV
jgi:hypothetical protein